jgi:hypothetical protein
MKSLLLLLLLIPSGVTYAQSCNPASVYYIVRDEKGVVLSKEDLQTMVDQLPKKIGDATVWATEVSFAPDKQTFYWPESVDFDKGTKVPALGLSNAATCTLHLTEVELKYKGRTMRLIFNIDIARYQKDRRQTIDSLKFQNGVFLLDLNKWPHHEEKLIPATYWKPAGR